MSQGNNLQDLSQIDYCLKQYYSKYMASALVQERKKILQEQKAAADKLYESQQRLPNFGAASNPFTKLDASEQLTKKSLDDLAERTTARWFKDKKTVNDYSVFVSSFYQALVANTGGRESKKLLEYANNYCASRLQKLMVEQLARERVPRNTAEYIAKKAFSESLLGLGNFEKLKKGAIGQSVAGQAEKMYNPSSASKLAGTIGGYAIDAVLTPGGVGKGVSTAGKMAIKAGKAIAGWGATDLAIAGGIHIYGKIWGNEDEEKKANRAILGDENASQKIQDGTVRYKKNGTELMMAINSDLSKKIKVPPLNLSTKAHKDANAFYAKSNGNAKKLLTSIQQTFSKQAIPTNDNIKVPAWMLRYGSKTNQGYASKFYSLALEMSRSRMETIKIGGRKMTLKEVSQRAYDYARAAVVVEKKQSVNRKQSHFSSSSQQDINQYDASMVKLNEAIDGVPKTKKQKNISSARTATSKSNPTAYMASSPYTQNASQGTAQIQQNQQASPSSMVMQQNTGWNNAMEQLGLNGFSDVSKNLGYVLAMLPDMIIGMFTGKTPNLKLQDNLMPVAAIMGGMFVKNPLLKMLLLGFGGANLLNKAGHAALETSSTQSKPSAKTYKNYADEALNPRIQGPVMKGCSMIATIDGVPNVINISEDAADAYAKGAIPINTLANAVLRKYDEHQALAAQKYEQHVNNNEEENISQARGVR